MQAGKVIGIVAAAGAVLLSLGLAAAGMAAVAITHASEDMRNWERWNDNDDRGAWGMRQRLIYWLFQKGKNCKHCCLWCEYYDLCRADVLAQNEREENNRKERAGT